MEASRHQQLTHFKHIYFIASYINHSYASGAQVMQQEGVLYISSSFTAAINCRLVVMHQFATICSKYVMLISSVIICILLLQEMDAFCFLLMQCGCTKWRMEGNSILFGNVQTNEDYSTYKRIWWMMKTRNNFLYSQLAGVKRY